LADACSALGGTQQRFATLPALPLSMAVSFRAFRAASYIGVAARGEQSS
jgi:hypothetical protein